jgi:RND family efflux transporter MFP subunit
MNIAKSLIFATCAAGLAGAAVFGASAWRGASAAGAAPAAVHPSIGPVRDVIIAKGTVGYAHQVSVRAPASGRVTALAAAEGADVRRGQALLDIDDVQRDSDRALRDLDLRGSEAKLAALRKELEVTRRLVEIGSVARYDLEQKTLELAAAERELDKARLELERHATRARLNHVSSPLAGIVLALPVVAGQTVAAGDELMTLAGGDALAIVAYVDAMDIERLRVGQTVDFSDQEDSAERRHGTVKEIGRAIAGAQRQNAVKVVIAAPQALAGLRVAQQLYVEFIVLDEPAALRVPKEFLRGEPGQRSVNVLTADGVVSRPLRTLRGDASFERVVSGVGVGDSLTRRPATVAAR